MKRRAVFFDRDNTLIACDEFLGDPAKVVLIEGAAEAVARARQLGYATVTVSNQSGVARGYFSEEAVHAVNSKLDDLLADANPHAIIDRHEFCPFHPDASIEKYRKESDMRKPQPGMILSAAQALALDLENSWLIGDAPRDIEAAKAAGCRAILFRHPELKRSPAADMHITIEPDYTVSSLSEALDYIAKFTASAGPASVEVEAPRAPEPMMTPAQEPLHIPEVKEEVKVQEEEEKEQLPEPEPAPATMRIEPQQEPAPIAPPPSPAPSLAKLESLGEEILRELRRNQEQPQADFSVSKLLAGIVQVIVLAVLFIALLNRSETSLQSILIFALTLQAMTIALLIMARQK